MGERAQAEGSECDRLGCIQISFAGRTRRESGSRRNGDAVVSKYTHGTCTPMHGCGVLRPRRGRSGSGPLSLSDALVEDAAVAGASRCAVEPGNSSSWIFRHSAPPSERTGHPSCQPPL